MADSPTDSFLFDGENALPHLQRLRQSLVAVNSLPPGQCPSNFTLIIDEVLPAICEHFKSLDCVSESLSKEIQLFTEQICQLAIRDDLSPKLLQIISSTFDDSMKPLAIYSIRELDLTTIKRIWNLEETPQLRVGRPQVSQVSDSLIHQVLNLQIFFKAIERIDSNSLSVASLSAILQLFLNMESSLSENYVSFILPKLANAAIDIAQKQPAEIQILQFLVNVAGMLPNDLDRIIVLFCEMQSRWNSSQNRSLGIHSLMQIVTDCGAGHSIDLVKTVIINALCVATHPTFRRQCFQFLSRIAPFRDITNQELFLIVQKAESTDWAIGILTALSRNLDGFAKLLLESETFYLGIFCVLISKVESIEISRELFDRVLRSGGRYVSQSFLQLEVGPRLADHISKVMESDNIEQIAALSIFFTNWPGLEMTQDYILRVISLAHGDDALFPVLMNFTRVLNGFRSEKVLFSLFENVLQSGKYDQFAEILVNWIRCSEHVPYRQIYGMLWNVDFSQCPDAFPPIIRELVSKRDNVSFLFKILSDTVPPRHSNWLVELLFRSIHSEREKTEEFVRIVLGNLHNSIFILQAAVQYEADFFRLSEVFGLVQSIQIRDVGKRVIDSVISFHPFHSTRRIYAHVADRLRVTISSISITIVDDPEKRILPPSAPLEVVEFHSDRPWILLVRSLQHETNHLVSRKTPFLDILSIPSNFLILFENLDNFLFQILTLMPPIGLSADTPLQHLLFGRCSDPFCFTDNVFPYALKAASDLKATERAFFVLLESRLDRVSLAIACESLAKIASPSVYSKDVLTQFLLDCESRVIRETFAGTVSFETDKNLLIPLIQLSTKKEYRVKTKQFFGVVRAFKLPLDIFVLEYSELPQFEISHYSDVDETFVALVSLCPKNEELVTLTLKRLFTAPTCFNLSVPFVHTPECWAAALQYAQTPLAIPTLRILLSSLQTIPTSTHQLSDDFSNCGRNGISNMGSTCYVNALFQILNACEHVSLKLISRPSEGLTPFVYQVREVLARLRFTRGQSLSIAGLIATIPNFNTRVHEDAGEFLNMLIDRLQEELEDSREITDPMRGQLTAIIRTGNEKKTPPPQDFLYLSLPTKNLSCLDEAFAAYFKEERMDGSESGVPRYRQTVVTRWPDYLVLQLERWEFDSGERNNNKLVHEFQFPAHLCAADLQRFTSCDVSYSLTGVVVHRGTAEQGHYVTIVQGNFQEWYVCNDQRIEYFNIDQLPGWAFGLKNETPTILDDVSTGYLLFYTRKGLDAVSISIPPDLERLLNRENAAAWPQTIFYSPSFIRYVKEIVLNNLSSPEAVEICLNVFFRIVVADDGKELQLVNEWLDILTNLVLTTPDRLELLVEFMDKQIGDSLASILSISDAIAGLITHVVNQLTGSTRPVLVVLKHLKQVITRRPVTNFVCDLIANACYGLAVDWGTEDEVLCLFLDYISAIRNPTKSQTTAFSRLMEILNGVVQSKGITKPIVQLFDVERLNLLCSYGKKSEHFQALILAVHELRPTLFQRMTNANPAVRMILKQMLPVIPVSGSTETSETNFEWFLDDLMLVLFKDDDSLRKAWIDALHKLLEDSSDSVLLLAICSQRQRLCEYLRSDEENLCGLYIELMHELSIVRPRVICQQMETFVEAFRFAVKRSNRIMLLEVIQNLIEFEPNLKKQLSDEKRNWILESNLASPGSVNLVNIFREYANGSPLVAACVQYYFEANFDENAKLLLEIMGGGLVPAHFVVPEGAKDVSALKFATSLWDIVDWKRQELSTFMLSALEYAKPIQLFRATETVSLACTMLEKYCPERLESVLLLAN
jgi:ubiquitin C-terminal hydrolase